jgi:hypothetical protein
MEDLQQDKTHVLCQTLVFKTRRSLVNYEKYGTSQPATDYQNGAMIIRFACRLIKTKLNNSNNT